MPRHRLARLVPHIEHAAEVVEEHLARVRVRVRVGVRVRVRVGFRAWARVRVRVRVRGRARGTRDEVVVVETAAVLGVPALGPYIPG